MTCFLRSFATPILLAVSLFAAVPAYAAQPAQCAECGMIVDPGSKFHAQITLEGKTLPFCDIGDLLTYLIKKQLSTAQAEVKDTTTGEWISADKAFYVQSEKTFKTPMGWGIAAFKMKEEAAAFGAPLDIKGILRAMK